MYGVLLQYWIIIISQLLKPIQIGVLTYTEKSSDQEMFLLPCWYCGVNLTTIEGCYWDCCQPNWRTARMDENSLTVLKICLYHHHIISLRNDKYCWALIQHCLRSQSNHLQEKVGHLLIETCSLFKDKVCLIMNSRAFLKRSVRENSKICCRVNILGLVICSGVIIMVAHGLHLYCRKNCKSVFFHF